MLLAATLMLLLRPGDQAIPEIKLSTSRFVAQWGYVRAAVEAKEAPTTPGLKAAYDDLIQFDSNLPIRIKTRTGAVVEGRDKAGPLFWRTLDALVFSAGSVDDLARIPELMPKIGGELDAESAVKLISKAMTEARPEFDAAVWHTAKKESQGRIDEFKAIPVENREAALRSILAWSGIAKAPERVSLLTVPKMAGKEGMTVRTPSGPLVVIGAARYVGADFAEVVLHESTHVLDSAAGEDSLFGRLRVALKAAKRPDFEVEQAPHVCMFLMAAEAVRRSIDPTHRDVGATFGVYGRGLEPLRKVVEPEMRKLMDGKASQEDAVKAIVAGLAG
jgi:hypothetical protein